MEEEVEIEGAEVAEGGDETPELQSVMLVVQSLIALCVPIQNPLERLQK